MASNLSNMDFSLLSGQQETSIGLFQTKFDFSLVKLEAPVEYQGLGRHLSPKRKTAAEDGTFHITAQKLGALFVDDLPQIPNLKKAYGVRSSGIAEDPKLNPKGNASHGPFEAHVGADGTSIWAAAKSGPGALEVHLLACILARVWSSAEATSIWDELVLVRKQVLTDRLNEGRFHFTTPMTARMDISRELLADWDASARSWIRIADKAMEKQQKQLTLIIENIGLSIPSRPQVYDSVMLTWRKSLSTMEHLVSGVAQRVQTPEALLGLSSWHIYPDLIVLGADTIFVEQDDTLVQKGGVVTLGMRSANSENDVGIMWTMSLARLRFYGKPTLSTRSINPSSSRVPFFRILQVALGSAISCWGESNSDFKKVCHLLFSLDKLCDRDLQHFYHAIPDSPEQAFHSNDVTQAPADSVEEVGWCKLFANQARSFLSAKEGESEEFLRYVRLGKRLDANFGADFLAASCNHPQPVFGLSSISDLLDLLDTEDQIKVLREIVTTFETQFDPRNCLIVYSPVSDQDEESGDSPNEYATLFPQQYAEFNLQGHRRWLRPKNPHKLFPTKKRDRDYELLEEGFNDEPAIKRSIFLMETTGEPCGFLDFQEIVWEKEATITPATKLPSSKLLLRWTTFDQKPDFEILKQCAQGITSKVGTEKIMYGWQIGVSSHQFFDKRFLQVLRSGSVAVYQSTHSAKACDTKLSIDYIQKILDSDLPRPLSVLGYLWRAGSITRERSQAYFKSLMALNRAAVLYNTLPEVDVELEVVRKCLASTNWSQPILTQFDTDDPLTQYDIDGSSPPFGMYPPEDTAYSILPYGDIEQPLMPIARHDDYWLTQDPLLPRHKQSLPPRHKQSLSPCRKTQADFACISFFDTGNVDLNPAHFDDILAISTPGSLYVSEVLLNDPAKPDDSKIRCLIGNIGRPGLALLRPPFGPMFREAEIESWRLVNHNAFDNRLEDNFRATSLQLTLTGSETPIDISRQSLRDTEVFYAEATISAHDHGIWIGDINVLKVNTDWKQQRPALSEWLLPRTISHVCNHEDGQKQDFTSFGPVVSIDSWFEYLDAPQSPSIVRAKGNYIARLAIAAAQRQRGGNTILVKDAVCWFCVARLAHEMNMEVDSTMIIC
ncbi:MAG: hypothetical protein M1821_002489 [Bathelium mastoideum]|nr:MAG: hypothetical protein M1821_002489 [Bathelium mastoideum]